MGRQLKRVPLDFNWPINQTWRGFLNPYHSQECNACKGNGLNPATQKLSDDWYCFGRAEWIDIGNGRRYNNLAWQYHLTEVEVKALLDADRLWDFTRVPVNDEQREVVKEELASGRNSWLPYNNGNIPTPEEVNEWAKRGMGHDGLNQHICVKARATHLGVYGYCEQCNGEGEFWASDEVRKLHDEWEPSEPPAGEGYQMWENTSKGSPQSPVFATLDGLCQWLEDNNASVFGGATTTKEKWKAMLSEDFVHHQEGNVIFI